MAKVNTTNDAAGTDDVKNVKREKAARLAAIKARNADPFMEQRDALRAIMAELDALSLDSELTSANRMKALSFMEAIDDGDGSGVIPDHCAEPAEETADDE